MTDKRGIKRIFGRVLSALTAFLIFTCFLPNLSAQNIRLRSNADPVVSTSKTKYADLTADGNIAVMGSYSARGAFIFDISNANAPILKAHYNPSPQQLFVVYIVLF